MSNDISAFGMRLNLVASNTFPAGFTITQFADDSDPLDMPSIKIADSAMGLNGDLLYWNTAVPLPITIAVIPGSEDDKNLGVLFEANRASKGKVSSKDSLTLTVVYPDNSMVTFTNGTITDGMPADGVASAGRKKSKIYAFVFEGKQEVNN